MNTEDFKDLDKEIYSISEKFKFYTIQHSIESLMEMYEYEELFLNQTIISNVENMCKNEKSEIIEKLLVRNPISIYVFMDKKEKYEVLSGGDDLAIIFSFFGYIGDTWSLEGVLIKSSKGINIKSLPLKYQIAIKKLEISVKIITKR